MTDKELAVIEAHFRGEWYNDLDLHEREMEALIAAVRRLTEEREAWTKLSRAQDRMLAIYRSGNHHRAGPVIEKMEQARKAVQKATAPGGGDCNKKGWVGAKSESQDRNMIAFNSKEVFLSPDNIFCSNATKPLQGSRRRGDAYS